MDKLERLMSNRWDYELFKIIFNPELTDTEASEEFIDYVNKTYKSRKDGKYIGIQINSMVTDMDTLFIGDNDYEGGIYLFNVSRPWAYNRILHIQEIINDSQYKYGIDIWDFDIDDFVIDQIKLKMYYKNKSKFRIWFEKTLKDFCFWVECLPISIFIYERIISKYKYRHG